MRGAGAISETMPVRKPFFRTPLKCPSLNYVFRPRPMLRRGLTGRCYFPSSKTLLAINAADIAVGHPE
jgi:hypothetical protein